MRINVTVDEYVYKDITKISKNLGCSISGTVNIILNLALKNENIKKFFENLEKK